MRWFANDERHGKFLLITATLFMWLLILLSFKFYGYDETWELWRVPVEHPQFSDFRLIPGSAESYRKGIEPTQRNPGDPHHRIFNYPAFWRLFFYTGIAQQDTVWIVISMLVLLFAGVFLFPDRITIPDVVGLLLVMFSPAAMLLYERGNVDLMVFFLCVLVIVACDYSATLAALLLIFASIVKIFPFFGVAVLLRESRAKFLLLSAVCGLALTGYMLKTHESVATAWNLTMRGDEISYGANVFFLRYSQSIFELTGIVQTSLALKYGPLALAFILILAAGWVALTGSNSVAVHSDRNMAAFRMGASIYAGTFLLGNNWDYRLAFLILAVPQLMEWSRGTGFNRFRLASIFLLALIFISCWHFMVWFAPSLAQLKESVFILDECANWLMLAGFGYLLVGSAPGWVRDVFWSLLPKSKVVGEA